MDKKEIEKVVNKFLLSYGEEPNNYNEVFYNSKKNIGINVFMFLCDLVEDLSQPKEVEPKKEVDLDEYVEFVRLTANSYKLTNNNVSEEQVYRMLQSNARELLERLPHLQKPVGKLI